MSLPEGKIPLGPSPGLQYSRTINYVFENPNWLLNAVWSFVCQLVAGIIPVVPQMVLMGYQFEVIDSLLESRGTRYPDFNPNRIVDYLVRGVWPFLAMLVMAIAWGAVFVFFALLSGGCIVAASSAAGQDVGPVVATVGTLFAIAIGLLLFAMLMLLVTPAALRGGLTQDFGAAFDFGWISDFIRKMWVEILLSTLFLIVVGLAAIVLTCGLGWFVVTPLVPFVQAHLWYQFYVLYLARGGSRVPMKKVALPANVVTPPTY